MSIILLGSWGASAENLRRKIALLGKVGYNSGVCLQDTHSIHGL